MGLPEIYEKHGSGLGLCAGTVALFIAIEVMADLLVGYYEHPRCRTLRTQQTRGRQAYHLIKLIVADVAGPRVSNAMSGDVLRPFGCDYLRATLRALAAKYSVHRSLPLHTRAFAVLAGFAL
jgi:hypothetical protein